MVEKIQNKLEPKKPNLLNEVLEVSASLTDKKWVFSDFDERQALGMAQTYHIPEIVGRVISSRGIPFEEVQNFLEPTLKVQLPNPSQLKDMDKAAERIAQSIINKEKIAIFGDYDVDGATSTALFKRFFQATGHDITVYIPDRMKEGYGPNAPALLKLGEEGHKTIITVDCGVTSFEPLAEATAAGIEMIVLDHHVAELDLPDAYAVVNPNRLDEDGSLGNLAAVGVSFLTLVAINRHLRDAGWYKEQGIAEPKLTRWLDIVALGTVCDVVPLTGVNRAFVAQGLKVMAMRQNRGLMALSDIAGIDEMPNAFHAGFILGPRINAGGRVGEADLGTKLLSTEDQIEANEIAAKLHQYNKERRDIEQQVLDQAIEQVESRGGAKDDYVVIAAGDNWHPGVIGIVASRLKEKYNRPACVIGFDDDGVGKASGRSVSGVDLGSAIIAARQNDILVAGGGHKMAAGFTVMKDQLPELQEFLNQRISDALNGQLIVPELRVDGLMTASSLTLGLTKKLEVLAPFGAGNSEPRFAIMQARIVKAKAIGADQDHVSCFIQDSAGGGSLQGISFRCMETPLGEALLKAGDAPLHLVGYVRINRWNGFEKPQFQIIDAAPVWN
jgi:single-stranded-DNA-specific exonuclease